MPKFLTASGAEAKPDDPDRTLWYSASCGFWTDDWSLLGKFGPGIPCCPTCQCVGMQTEAGKWEIGAIRHDRDDPGYLRFLNDHKATCLRTSGGLMKAWQAPADRAATEDGRCL